MSSYTATQTKFVRICNKTDFETQVRHWFFQHGWEAAPQWEDMPPTTTYVVYDQNNILVAFSALYVTNSSIAIMDWTVVNQQYNAYGRVKALKMLIAHIEAVALLLEKKKLIHFIVPENLAEHFKKRLGFQRAESAHILVKVISDK
jgi:N-acetylglutamate synthase-like GNAT family acetyltransferase